MDDVVSLFDCPQGKIIILSSNLAVIYFETKEGSIDCKQVVGTVLMGVCICY